MSTNKKDNEIDSFTKALLDSKKNGSQMVEKKPQPENMDIDKNEAEQQLKEALDHLRVQRGQQPISDEERRYRDTKQPEEDFTTATIVFDQDNTQVDYLHQAMGKPKTNVQSKQKPKHYALPDIPDSLEETKTKLIDKGKHMKRKASEKITQVDHSFDMDTLNLDFTKNLDYTTTQPIKIEPTHHLNVEKAKKRRFKVRVILLLMLLVILAGLMVGYAYKTTIYDPQHNITAKMSKTYDKLVSYADEWDMSSDSEKNEILGYEKDYQGLTDSQKTDINAYFKEQTGKKLTTLFKDLKKENHQKEKDTYDEITNYLSAWNTYDTTQQNMVYDYLEPYSTLTKAHKKALNKKTQSLAGVNFQKFCETYKPTTLKTDAQKVEEYKDQLESAKNELESAQSTQDRLETYAQDPESYGYTEDSIQEAIDENEKSIDQINARIESLENRIDQLS